MDNKDRLDIKRILVVTLSNIGDVILTTPVVEALIRQYPAARIDIVAGPNGREIFEKNKKISKIFIYDKRSGLFEKFRLLKKLKHTHYDMAVDLKNTMIPFLIGAAFKSRPLGRKRQGMHKKDQHLAVINSMGINTRSLKMNIATDADDLKNVEELLSDVKGDFVVASCGAKSHTKRWPAENFAALCDCIRNELAFEIILVGKDEGDFPDSDRVVADKVKREMKTRPRDFLGKTNIRELALLIKKAKALITNDSAPLHIASAVSTPTIAIFGPTDPKKYGPLADDSIVLRKFLKCEPCEKPECGRNYECMREITVEEAFAAVKRVLGY